MPTRSRCERLKRGDTHDDPSQDDEARLSRRNLLRAGAVSGVAGADRRGTVGPAAAAACGNAIAPSDDPDDIVLINGRIHTMEARTPWSRRSRSATAGSRPSATGRPASPARGSSICAGAPSCPGSSKPHVHIVSLANRPGYHTILENTRSIREIQETLAARRKSVPEGQWITSMGGWHPNQWAEHRHPTLKELDEAVPDRPVLLYERFTGPAVTNSMGKKFFDAMDAAPPVHPDVKTVAVAENGAIAAAGFAGGGPAASALFHLRAHADVRGQEAQHARRDGVFGEPRR